MKHAEIESFIKSFLVFFLSLSLLSALVFWYEYTQKRHVLEETVFNEMKVCSFDLKCQQFTFDFDPLHTATLYVLNQDESGYYALFSIPSSKYALKLHLSQERFDVMLHQTRNTLLQAFLMTLFVLGIISVLFSLYTLYPLKKALQLTQEFSRDILHDFNTPLASLRLNISLLKVSPTETKKIQRIERSIETMISLGNNLRSYLEGHPLQKEYFDLHTLLEDRIATIQKLYPSVSFILDSITLSINANQDAITRILDNLLSNACKYNKENGSVWITINLQTKTLHIDDNGKGIEHPEKVFDRFYKEHERGLGIGLHIVKKLCDELKIAVHVKSVLHQGTSFTLDLHTLTLH
ncbi:MAG: sensor histidine kinase [Sulfuricurvum sp.]